MSWLSAGIKSASGIGTQLLQGFSGKSAAQSQTNANVANVQMAREQMAFSADQAAKANAFSATAAKNQQDYEERMSNTSYQRATADMKAAGINPMLAIDQGGAGTPSVSAPSGDAASSSGATVMPVPPRMMTMLSNARDVIQTYSGLKSAMASSRAADASAVRAGAETVNIRNKQSESQFDNRLYQFMNGLLDRVTGTSAFHAVKGWQPSDGFKPMSSSH